MRYAIKIRAGKRWAFLAGDTITWLRIRAEAWPTEELATAAAENLRDMNPGFDVKVVKL